MQNNADAPSLVENTVPVHTAAGDMPTFIVHPAKGGPFPVIVMLMDAGGIRDGLRQNARDLATQNYYVMLPNLFHRSAGTGPIEDLHDMARITELNTGLKNEDAVGDVAACARHAGQDAHARDADHIGLIGYCMGGRLSVTVAQALGEQVAAVVSLHPGYMATRSESSPHLFLDNIKAKVYFGLAETDPHLSSGQVERLKAALDRTGVDYQMEILPGTEHGFAVPGRETYSASGARAAEMRARELFASQLQ